MEDLIKKAETTKSKCGEFCKIVGIVSVGVGITVLLHSLVNKINNYEKGIIALTGGAALSALGNNATSNKRTAELNALLVRTTNSASPIPKKSEYS